MRVLGNTIKWSAALGLGLLTLTGCEEPTTFVPTNSDAFSYYDRDSYDQANAVLQADYLFVADYSYSMHDKVEDIVGSLDTFADDLTANNIDYKIGFVRGTTSSSGDTIKYIPKSLVGPAIVPSANNLQSLMDLQLGVEGFGTPLAPNRRYMFEAARRVATNTSLGFLREASQLVYVFISDNDDVSVNDSALGSKSVQDYVTSLRVKSDSSYVNARAWVLGQSSDCAINSELGSGEGAGDRLAAAARALNAGTSEAVQCLHQADGMAASLQDLARNVTRPTKRFKLRATPVSAASISITVDGNDQVMGTDWDYASATHEVVFRADHEPAPGSSLEIAYSPLFVLSNNADKSTIVVTVDGVPMDQSDTDGWSYVESKRQIVINGSGIQEGSAIRVTYQAK